MKKGLLALCLIFWATTAHAGMENSSVHADYVKQSETVKSKEEVTNSPPGISFQIGYAAYSITDTYMNGTANYSSPALVLGVYFRDFASYIFHIYTAENTSNALNKIDGYDLQYRFGSFSPGVIYYAGFGLFSDVYDNGMGSTMDAFGYNYGLGIGYKWGGFSLDYSLGWKESSDYPTDYSSKYSSIDLIYTF